MTETETVMEMETVMDTEQNEKLSYPESQAIYNTTNKPVAIYFIVYFFQK